MPATLEEEHRKALKRPIDGPYPDLAREVRRLMGHGNHDPERPFLTSRMGQNKSGVHYATIASAMRGFRVKEDALFRLAYGLGGDAKLLLSLAGYPPSAYFIRASAALAKTDDAGEDEIRAIYQRLPLSSRKLLLSLARSVQDCSSS